VHDWFEDIYPLILDRMGLTDQTFRSYQEVDGKREYRDYWHVFLATYGERMHSNDSYFTMASMGDTSYMERIAREKYGEWAVPLIPVIDGVIQELAGPDEEGFSELVVWISW
jgi:hypothetical protein